MARLLVIDDNDALRAEVAAGLRKAGHVVVPTASGREAVRLFRADPADAVITELVVPDQDGIETLVTLRREFPGVPVIAMSGASRHASLYLKLARRLGAERTLVKPFSVGELVQIVREVLATHTGSMQPELESSPS
jgi:DNA-binding response OmpR family regulator